MRSSKFNFLGLVLLTFTGCGTFHNLKDSPNGPMFIGTGCCYPFGGVTRSGILAVMGPPYGLCEIINGNTTISKGEFGPGFEQIGQGMYMTSAGLVAIADIPLSLACDILTLPIVYARSKEYSWATWWGEKSSPNPGTQLEPAPNGDNKKFNPVKEPTD